MSTLFKAILFLIIVGAGLAGYFFLVKGKKEPRRKKPKSGVVTVVVEHPVESRRPVVISSMGTVIPAKTVRLFPEVGGKIVYQNPRLVPGGRFLAGEKIIKINPKDYDLLLAQQSAAVARAQMELTTEKARAAVAKKEWELTGEEVQITEEGKQLALRQVQLDTAQAALKSAKSGLGTAKLRRSRTLIRAPFNALVLDEFVDKGQVLSPAANIATLVGTDAFWVRVSVPVDRLPWIQIPGVSGSTVGSMAQIEHKLNEEMVVTRQGQVVQLLSSLDPNGKMARLIVEIKNPLGSSSSAGSRKSAGGTRKSNKEAAEIVKRAGIGDVEAESCPPVEEANAEIGGVQSQLDCGSKAMPLLLGAQVNVNIIGPTLPNIFAIPRQALKADETVWIYDGGQLKIQKVSLVWSHGSTAFVSGHLNANVQVITSRIAAPVEGMKLKLQGMGDLGEAAGERR